METNRLRQFRIIVETSNLRKASELLGISHSGLSKSMAVFETELGFPLFHASGRGLVISDEGKRLFERSGPFLEELEHLLGHRRESVPDVLRIGSFEVFTSYFMGPLLGQYFAGQSAEIHELIPGRLEEALLLNRIDVGITYEPVPRKGIEYTKVARLAVGLFALKGKFTRTEIAKIPFIVPVSPLEGAPSGVKGLDAWPEQKMPREIRYRVDSMATGLELVRQGLGAIFIPRFVAHLHNAETLAERQIESLELAKNLRSIKRAVYIVRRESTSETATSRKIAAALRELED